DRSLSVEIKRGIWNCHHYDCKWTGSIHKRSDSSPVPRIYMLPEPKFTDLSDKTIKWFRERGITLGTLKHFQIKESQTWMPAKEVDGKTSKEGVQTCINFPYYRGDRLINIKFRGALKNFRLSKESELIF